MKLLFVFFVFPANYLFGQKQTPNIIYIMADDLGYADLSCYGRKDYATPHLDKLATQGMRFSNAYAAGPVCTPTRTSFMTGRYPARTPVGLLEPLRPTKKDSAIGLNPSYPSIASLLKRAGYETALIGKWHLGFLPEHSPNNNGFDAFFGFNAGATDYISHQSRNHIPDLYENEKPVKIDGYMTDIFKDKVIEFLSHDHAKPFFLSIQFNAPHWPWQGPGDKPYHDTLNWTMGGSPSIYANMMKSLDNAVGDILETLDRKGLSENTVVIFTSDNGGEKYSDMGIYSGGKFDLWDGGIRVPAFIRWPGKIPANSSTDQVVVTMDWSATILGIANAKSDPAFPLDGENMLPVCVGNKKVYDRTLFWRIFQGKQEKAMRWGNWKYLQNENGEYLFDLLADPTEKKNLKDEVNTIFTMLKKKYADWEMTVPKPLPL